MSELRPWSRIQYADPMDVFGDVTTQPVEIPEPMSLAFRRQGHSSVETRWDDALQCMTLTPIYVPTDTPYDSSTMTLTDCTTDEGTWRALIDGTTGKAMAAQTAAPKDLEWSYTAGTGPDVLLDEGAGLWINVQRSAPRPDATRDAAHCYWRFTVTLTADVLWRIAWHWGENPRLEQTADGGATWTRVGDIPVADGGLAASGEACYLRFQVLRANGRVAFRATPNNAVNETALVVSDTGQDPIYPVCITGMNSNAAFRYFPVKWASEGTFTSRVHQKQWDNMNSPVIRVDGTRDTATPPALVGITGATVDTGSNWTAQYILTLTAQTGTAGSGTVTPIVRKATLRYPPTVAGGGRPNWQDLPGSTGYTLRQEFDPYGPTVRRGGTLTGDNYFAGFAADYGMVAVRVLAGVDVVADNGATETLWQGVRFVGWANLETLTEPMHFQSELTDRIGYELEVPLCADVIMDGDCIYHAVRQLLYKGGFTDDWLQSNMPGAPTDAWTCDGITCDPSAPDDEANPGTAGHYRLGSGTNETPLWEFDARQTIWSCIQSIAAEYRMFAGVTSDGYAEFFPFRPENSRANWAPKQVFSQVPAFSWGLPSLNEFVGTMAKRVSRRNVKNRITLIGLDERTWEPIVSYDYDAASAWGSQGDRPPTNYMGRVRPYVETNPRYSSQALADMVRARKFVVMRVPLVYYDPLEVLFQPLFPLDYIGIRLNRTMDHDEMFYVGSAQETVAPVWGPLGVERVDARMMLTVYVVPD